MLPEFIRRKFFDTEHRLDHWDAYVRSVYVTILVIMAYLLGYEFDMIGPYSWRCCRSGGFVGGRYRVECVYR